MTYLLLLLAQTVQNRSLKLPSSSPRATACETPPSVCSISGGGGDVGGENVGGEPAGGGGGTVKGDCGVAVSRGSARRLGSPMMNIAKRKMNLNRVLVGDRGGGEGGGGEGGEDAK